MIGFFSFKKVALQRIMDQTKTLTKNSISHLFSSCDFFKQPLKVDNTHFPLQLAIVSQCYQHSHTFVSGIQQRGVVLPAALQTARVKRQAEYLAGRHCASVGLGLLGAGSTMVGSHHDRSPLWPHRYTGSITHSHGLAMAVTGEKRHYRSIGVDIERIVTADRAGRLSKSVLTAEDNALRSALSESKYWFFTLVFSAKESLYKLLHPELKRFIGFESAYLSSINTGKKTFTLTLKDSLSSEWHAGVNFFGHYFEIENYLISFLYLEAAATGH